MDDDIQVITQVTFVKNKSGLFNYRISHLWHYRFEFQTTGHEEIVRNVSIIELRKIFKKMTSLPNVTKIRAHKRAGNHCTKCVEYYFF